MQCSFSSLFYQNSKGIGIILYDGWLVLSWRIRGKNNLLLGHLRLFAVISGRFSHVISGRYFIGK